MKWERLTLGMDEVSRSLSNTCVIAGAYRKEAGILKWEKLTRGPN